MSRQSLQPSGTRRILHVDCDAFFVQVARLEDPDGIGLEDLLLVGGTPEGRGVVTSASYAVRAYGVRSGMPTAEALRRCPQAKVVPVPRSACVRRSGEVKRVLDRLSPVVQAASVDEFYLDLTGTERLFGRETLTETAERIRMSVLAETSVSVSIGGATRRLVAKLATRRAKPAGVHVVPAGQEASFLRGFDLADIPGVGPSFARALEKRGLVTVNQTLGVEREWLERWFGEGRGGWLYDRIRGQDRSRVLAREPRRSISSERTFFRDIDDDEALEGKLMKLSLSVGRSLRRHHLRARTVSVKLRDNDFTTRNGSRTSSVALETDTAIFSIARELLAALRGRRRRPARLLGVALTNFEEGPSSRQLGLFSGEAGPESQRDRDVAHMLDRIRDRFGDDAVVPGRIVRPSPPPSEESRSDARYPSPDAKPG